MTGPFGDGPVRVVHGAGLRAARDAGSPYTTPQQDTAPQQDMEASTAALAALGEPGAAARLRVHRPRPTAAFSRVDSLAPGFPAAQDAARAHGFVPVVRPAGGRLAAYHRGALVLDLVAPHPEARRNIRERFSVAAQALAGGLRELGVDARVGPVPGEYCPGDFSVNSGGATKLVGTAQRLTRYGYLFSAVVLVADPEPVREVLRAAYAALEFGWDPASVGCVADAVPGVTVDDVAAVLVPRVLGLVA
jgi:octanoyl-[GcvH]:protein N-octanoyltransferase